MNTSPSGDSLPDVESLLDGMAKKLDQTLLERNITNYVIIGIRTGGVLIAEALSKKVGYTGQIGELDISFYRDDFTRIGLNPSVRPTSLPFSCDNAHIVLVDDILMSGRTVRAAMNELFDFGRPASITLAVLLDIGQRELPIFAEIVGDTINLANNQRIKVEGPDQLKLVIKEDLT